ncbi:MAG: hypothetical protein ACPG05_04745 [Bdellovibrionales bacterium]
MLRGVLLLGSCLVSLSFTPVLADEGDLSVKKELAAKLHEAWGVREQAMGMIDLVTQQVPVAQRADFYAYMTKVIDMDEFEKISVESAVDVFTKEELETMLAYYSQDIAKAAEAKRLAYNETLAPKIQKMIDKGMIEATGEMNRLKGLK